MTTIAGKNIIVCSDGTGNTAIKGRGTNVFKIFESVDLNGHRFNPDLTPQVATYDDGVGTEDFKLVKLLGGAFGYGLGRNVRQLYKELCRIYDPGDRIFLFGFSRGAFTVRTLAGLICTCGIIDVAKLADSEEFEATVALAYKAYRSRYRTDLARFFRGEPDRREVDDFRAKHCHPAGRIRFIGVWDTVDAVGLPLPIADFVNKSIYRFKFPDLRLSDSVDFACHALAVDDERHSFHPLLWDESKPKSNPEQVLEQVWFSGVHSNVGGGYPKQGMSLVVLDWIMHRAEDAGLRFVPDDRDFYHRHATVDDKLYNPRAGLGIFYRWKPRDIALLCRKSAVQPTVHLSVMERIAHGTDDYCPGNLPPDSAVIITPTHDRSKDAAARARATEAQRVLKESHGGEPPLLTRSRAQVRVGRYSYYAFMLTCAGVVAFAATTNIEPEYSWRYLLAIGNALAASPVALALVIGGLLAALSLSTYADRSMQRRFSQFWFQQQKQLRAALKRARKNMQLNRA